MNNANAGYGFFRELARIINAGQSRSVLLSGNVHDLFFVEGEGPHGDYVPLLDFLCKKCQVKGLILVVCELNGPLRVLNPADREKLKTAWIGWKVGTDWDQFVVQGLNDKNRQRQREELETEFENHLRETVGNATLALEFLRQLTICSRSNAPSGRAYLPEHLLILIEAADMLLPAGNGEISNLSPVDRHRVGIAQDWFSDPGLMRGEDTVILLAESRSLVHPRVARLPPVLGY